MARSTKQTETWQAIRSGLDPSRIYSLHELHTLCLGRLDGFGLSTLVGYLQDDVASGAMVRRRMNAYSQGPDPKQKMDMEPLFAPPAGIGTVPFLPLPCEGVEEGGLDAPLRAILAGQASQDLLLREIHARLGLVLAAYGAERGRAGGNHALAASGR